MATKDLYANKHSSVQLTEAIGQSEIFLEFQQKLSHVAPVDRPVLLLGERGTGKELAAAKLHFLSKRWQGPLVAINCAALNPSLIESELFGYEKGAYTGADRRRRGRFEAADGGTLFLDEIGTIPLEAQSKILRAVEYGTFERVGSSESIEVDVRIIAATNADLPALVDKGLFKQDLLDRISFEVLLIPPLRERREDIILLANHFAARMALEIGRKNPPYFSKEATAALNAYSWPGNIRELKNLIERTVYRTDAALIHQIDFDPFSKITTTYKIANDSETTAPSAEKIDGNLLDLPLDEAIRALKCQLLKFALISSQYNQRKAAERLGLSYDQFRGLYRKFKRAIIAS